MPPLPLAHRSRLQGLSPLREFLGIIANPWARNPALSQQEEEEPEPWDDQPPALLLDNSKSLRQEL